MKFEHIINSFEILLNQEQSGVLTGDSEFLGGLEDILDDLKTLVDEERPWSNDSRPAPQVHMRLTVGGLKRVPEAGFTIDGDIRDVDMDEFFAQRDRFQAEVDKRFPLPTDETK